MSLILIVTFKKVCKQGTRLLLLPVINIKIVVVVNVVVVVKVGDGNLLCLVRLMI